jgi:hypothetical protein
MASDSIDNALIIQFSDMIHSEAQQIRARLRDKVQIKKMTGDTYAYDGLGDIEAREVFGRVQPVVFSGIEHLRRKISRRRFVVTLPIDDMDVRAVLLNPEGKYAMETVRAMERQFDRVVVEAAFSDVMTGQDFQNPVTAVADGVATVDATGGLTYSKLLEIKQNFMDREVGNDVAEDLYLAISGDEHTALMNETQLTSGDFTHEFVVERGRITKALGMDLVVFGGGVAKPMLDVTSGSRSCIAASTRGMCVGVSKEFSIAIKDRPDLVDTKQVQITGIIGAVRTEGVLIQKVLTTD